MSEPLAIQTENLTKQYGDLIALDSLNLQIGMGEVFGLIGPNGAGKTTTLKMMATLLRPSSGQIRIAGLSLDRDAAKVRQIIGYLPDHAGVYEDMQVDEYLTFFAQAASLPHKKIAPMVNDVLELTDLTAKKTALVESLSRGMCQRLGVARVLLHDPKVLILDEPASGLSPKGRVEMRMLLSELRAMNKTIVISSHILPELEALCTSIGILEGGKLLYTGTIDKLMQAHRRHNVVHVRVVPEELRGEEEITTEGQDGAEALSPADSSQPAMNPMTEKAIGLLISDPRIQSAIGRNDLIEVTVNPEYKELSFIPDLLIQNQIPLHLFRKEPLTLEDAFMRVTSGLVQ